MTKKPNKQEVSDLNEFGGKISPYQLIHIRKYAQMKDVSTRTVRKWAKQKHIYLVELDVPPIFGPPIMLVLQAEKLQV